MAEGGFDDMEMEERREGYLEYSDEELQTMERELQVRLDTFNEFGEGQLLDEVRVEMDKITGELDEVRFEMDRRQEAEPEVEEQESSFIDDGDGKTVTIARNTRGGTSKDTVEAPGVEGLIPSAVPKHFTATFKRLSTEDKKTFLRKVLGIEIRAGDGPNSKDLLRRIKANPDDDSAEFDGKRIFVRKGRNVGLTENKKMLSKVEEFTTLLRKVENERGIPMVDLTPSHVDIHGLTERENRELEGVLTPGPSTIRSTRIGDNGALQIQVEYLQRSIDETNDMINTEDVGSIREFELRERTAGLEEARDLTIGQREKEEVRERQEEDITRLERFKEWMKENWLGASALVAGVAGLLTTIIVGARSAAVKGAGAVKSFAKAVRDAIKKLGPWAVPIANFLYTLLKGGAAVLGWLASNLWVLVLAFLWFVYDWSKTYYKERRKR